MSSPLTVRWERCGDGAHFHYYIFGRRIPRRFGKFLVRWLGWRR